MLAQHIGLNISAPLAYVEVDRLTRATTLRLSCQHDGRTLAAEREIDLDAPEQVNAVVAEVFRSTTAYEAAFCS